MYFAYGNYTHSDNDVQLSLNKRMVRNARGLPERVVWTMNVQGELLASSQSAIRTAIYNLEAAYSRDGFDAGLFHDDGTLSPHHLSSSRSISGVRVVQPPSFPKGDGSEYATCRTYAIVLEAEYVATGGDGIVSFSETLRFTGTGGPRRVYQETLTGPPVRSITNQRTLCRATQSGQAVGFLSSPRPPSPLWPDLEVLDRRQTSNISPVRNGDSFINYGVAWTYEFESPSPLAGNSNRR